MKEVIRGDGYVATITFDNGALQRAVFGPQGLATRHLHQLTDEAMRLAKSRFIPKRTGTLSGSSYWKLAAAPNRFSTSTEMVAPKSYALAQHEGAAPHIIRARNAQYLRFVGRSGDTIYAKQVNHPGNPATKFFSKAVHAALASRGIAR